jgi:hypothetical protein
MFLLLHLMDLMYIIVIFGFNDLIDFYVRFIQYEDCHHYHKYNFFKLEILILDFNLVQVVMAYSLY